jgi:hypothetical protein
VLGFGHVFVVNDNLAGIKSHIHLAQRFSNNEKCCRSVSDQNPELFGLIKSLGCIFAIIASCLIVFLGKLEQIFRVLKSATGRFGKSNLYSRLDNFSFGSLTLWYIQ